MLLEKRMIAPLIKPKISSCKTLKVQAILMKERIQKLMFRKEIKFKNSKIY